MKTTIRSVLIGLIAGGAMLMADAVSIPHTFTANTTAKASEVNANFSAIEAAINTGSVVVHNSAFSAWLDKGDQCDLVRFPPIFGLSPAYFDSASTSSSCIASASVPIPEGADVTGMTCRYLHNENADMKIVLNVTYTNETGLYKTIKLLEISKDAASHGSAYQTESDHTVEPYPDTPSGYKSFTIEWMPPNTNTAGSHETFLDCKVDYTF